MTSLTDANFRNAVVKRSTIRLAGQAGVFQFKGTKHLVRARHGGLQLVGNLAGTHDQGIHICLRIGAGTFDHDIAVLELFRLGNNVLGKADICHAIDVLQREGRGLCRILHRFDLVEPLYAPVILDHGVIHHAAFSCTYIGFNKNIGLRGIPVFLAVACIPGCEGAQVSLFIGELLCTFGHTPIHTLGQVCVGIIQCSGCSSGQTFDIRSVRRELFGNLINVKVHDRVHAVRVLAYVDLFDSGLDQRIVISFHRNGVGTALVLENIGIFNCSSSNRDVFEHQLFGADVHTLQTAIELGVKVGLSDCIPLKRSKQGFKADFAVCVGGFILISFDHSPHRRLSFACLQRTVIQSELCLALADLMRIVRLDITKLDNLQRYAFGVGEVLFTLRIDRVVLYTVGIGEGNFNVVFRRVGVEHIALRSLGFNDVIICSCLRYQRNQHTVHALVNLCNDSAIQFGKRIHGIKPYFKLGAAQSIRSLSIVLVERDCTVQIAVGDLNKHFLRGAGCDLHARICAIRIGCDGCNIQIAKLIGCPDQMIAIHIVGRFIHSFFQPVAVAHSEISYLAGCILELDAVGRVARVAACGCSGQSHRANLISASLGIIDIQRHGPVEQRKLIIGMVVGVNRLMGLQGGLLRVKRLDDYRIILFAYGRYNEVGLNSGCAADDSLIRGNSSLQVSVGKGETAGHDRRVYNELAVCIIQRAIAFRCLALQEHIHTGILSGYREHAGAGACGEAAHAGPGLVCIIQCLDLCICLGRCRGRQRHAEISTDHAEGLIVHHKGRRLLQRLRVIIHIILGKAYIDLVRVGDSDLKGIGSQIGDGLDCNILVLAGCISLYLIGIANLITQAFVHQVRSGSGSCILRILCREHLFKVLNGYAAVESVFGEVVGAGSDVIKTCFTIASGGRVGTCSLSDRNQAELQSGHRCRPVQLCLLNGETQFLGVGHVDCDRAAAHIEIPVTIRRAGIGILIGACPGFQTGLLDAVIALGQTMAEGIVARVGFRREGVSLGLGICPVVSVGVPGLPCSCAIICFVSLEFHLHAVQRNGTIITQCDIFTGQSYCSIGGLITYLVHSHRRIVHREVPDAQETGIASKRHITIGLAAIIRIADIPQPGGLVAGQSSGGIVTAILYEVQVIEEAELVFSERAGGLVDKYQIGLVSDRVEAIAFRCADLDQVNRHTVDV